MVFQRTILPGGSKPLVIELPPYRLPGLRTALLHTFDRAKIFVKQAGTIILVISLLLWALSHYPKSAPPAAAVAMTAQAAQLEKSGDAQKADELRADADRLTAQYLAAKFLRRQNRPPSSSRSSSRSVSTGRSASASSARSPRAKSSSRRWPSFMASGEDAAEHHSASLYDSLRHATRSDGTPMFTTATCASLLVYYILAAQCLSTTAVVRRETNSWKWPLFQIAYMTGLAYFCAFIVYQTVSHFVH